LGQPEGEYQLGPRHEQLRGQSLEEGSEALVLHHVGDDPEAALGVLEVPVLDTGLDDVERSRDEERGTGTGDWSNEVLRPGCGIVVCEFVEVLLGYSRTTEQLLQR
jgi:hypothetical protein